MIVGIGAREKKNKKKTVGVVKGLCRRRGRFGN